MRVISPLGILPCIQRIEPFFNSALRRAFSGAAALVLSLSISVPAYSQEIVTDELVRNKIIITVSNEYGSGNSEANVIEAVRRELAKVDSQAAITGVKPLFPRFCALARNSNMTPAALHLALLNQGLTNVKAKAGRLELITSYLENPASELCNQFVIGTRRLSLRRAGKLLTSARFNSIEIRNIQPVHRYSIKRALISALASSQRRPHAPAAVISSPAVNADFFGLRWRNKGEIAGDGVDNESNSFADDVYGINSSERETVAPESEEGGFVTLAVGKDAGDRLRYTSIEAANALLYSIHAGIERIFLPFGREDHVLSDLAVIGSKLGVTTARSSREFDPFAQHITAAVNFGSDSSEPGVGYLSGCTAAEVGKRCLLTAAHCITSERQYYSNESTIHQGSEGPAIIRSALMSGGGLLQQYSDFAVSYATKSRYRIWTGEKTCDSGCNSRWSPKSLGTAARNDQVRIVGYASQDLRSGISGIYYRKREEKFKVTQILTTNTPGNQYDVLYLSSLGSGKVNNGDSGSPVLKDGNIVGVLSARKAGAVNTPTSDGIVTGMSFHQRSWIKEQIGRVCRTTGWMNIVSSPIPVTIKMKSEDPWGEPKFGGVVTCAGGVCSREFVKLSVSYENTGGLVFSRYESIAGADLCPCPPTDESCSIDATSLGEKFENLPGEILSACRAVFASRTPPSPTPTPTPRITPTKTPTPTPTRTPTNTPGIRTPTPTSTPTRRAAYTPYVTPAPVNTPTATPTANMCMPPKSFCDGSCVNQSTNPFHCGGCGMVCTSGRCLSGVCVGK